MRTVLLTTILLGCAGTDSAPADRTEPEEQLGCGDGVLAAGEACDDGNALGGDGCTERCTEETGLLETEPNDSWETANPLEGAVGHGGLPEGDVDCWSFEAEHCGAVTVRAVPPCSADLVLTLHDPSGVGVASGSAGPDGCAVIDPVVSAGADWTEAGLSSACASSLSGAVLPSYALEVSTSATPVGPAEADLDGDGEPDRCDADRDGDGVDDGLDNCPDLPNGPNMGPLQVSVDGFIREWLTLGPVTGTANTVDCRPSDENTLGVDADAAPRLGDQAGGTGWIAWFDSDDRINFNPVYGYVDPPREAYAHVYLWSATTRDLQLALGADDGVFSWLNGVQLHDVSSCQGTNVDQFVEPATVLAGWNRLTVKVRDHGGGWGLYARFLDLSGQPVADLELSLTPDGPWIDDQSDGDGDGTGDVCDDTP